jgi:PAS domain S-box-containing protein
MNPESGPALPTDDEPAFEHADSRLERNALLAALAARFLSVPGDRVDEAVRDALSAIGRFAGVDRVGLALFDERGEHWSVDHEWHAPSLWPIRGMQEHVAPFQWGLSRLLAGECLEILSTESLPREAANGALLLRGLGLSSMLAIPLRQRDRIVGFAALGRTAPRSTAWPEALHGMLELPANMMVRVLERRTAEKRLRESQARWNSLCDSNVVGVISTSIYDGGIVASNDAGLRLLGRSREELERGEIGWQNTTPEDQMEKDLRMFGILQKTGRVMPYEKLVLRPDGSQTPILMSMTSLAPHAPEIVTVAIDLSSRQRMAEELRRRDDIDRLHESLSRRLLDLAGGEIEDAVREAVGAVAAAFGFDGVAVYDCDHDAEHAVRRTWWSRSVEGQPEPEIRITLAQRTWWRERIRAGRIVRIGCPSDLPEEAAAEREAMDRFGLQAALSVPLMPGGALRGLLLFYAVSPMQLREDTSATLRVLGDIIANALERLRIDRDIAEAVATLEQRVDLRMRQLEASSEELESFAYSVSHDLRAPLRAIDGLAQVLREDWSAELGEGALELLQRIQAAARRMSRLIDGLLRLSRVVRTSMEWEEVSISDLAEGIAEEKRRLAGGRGPELVVTPGILLTGHPRLLRIAVEELLDNAFKFTSPREHGARVEVDATQDGERTVLHVRDNGVGFDPEFAAKLFGAFQRLHGPEEFEGHGIGLATVERVVRMHGGSAVASGRPGEGATISLRFPHRSPGATPGPLPESSPR